MVLIVTWVDDLLIMGRHDAVLDVKKQIGELMLIEDCEEMCEYVGYKITQKHDNAMVIKHPMIVQSFEG